MNLLPEKKYGVPSHNFVKKNVLREKGDELPFLQNFQSFHFSSLKVARERINEQFPVQGVGFYRQIKNK